MFQKKKANHEIKAPSSPEEAWRMLEALSIYFSSLPALVKFKPRVLCDYLSKGERKGERSIRSALGLLGGKLGRPEVPLESIKGLAALLYTNSEKAAALKISNDFGVSRSYAEKLRAKINVLFERRQHGAKPDKWSSEDAAACASKIPEAELKAIRQGIWDTITAADILPD
jgi:hypothetical protein